MLSCPDEAAPHADALAIGEGVRLWPEILHDVEAGTLKSVYQGSYQRPYREEPAPRRDLLPRSSFLTTTSLIATRGCHNRCGFCYLATDGLTMPYQVRDVEQVVAEFRADGQPYGVFVDNNLGSRPEYLRRLCLALRPAREDLERRGHQSMSPMIRRWCVKWRWPVAPASLSASSRWPTPIWSTPARKRPAPPTTPGGWRSCTTTESRSTAASCSDSTTTTRMFSRRTVAWIEENRLECATFHILTPYPGTPLFRQMEAENRFLHKDWSRYDTAHVVFMPKNMSVDELAEGYAWCYHRLFSHRSIWRRRPRDPQAVAPYLAMSYLYKRSNFLWQMLIRHRLTSRVWQPLVERTRRRHLRFRRRLDSQPSAGRSPRASTVVSAGV